MTHSEAKDLTRRFNKHPNLVAFVVRTLPRKIDPPVEGDNGWDVEVTDISPPPISGEGWSF